jgi:hypothetical protein
LGNSGSEGLISRIEELKLRGFREKTWFPKTGRDYDLVHYTAGALPAPAPGTMRHGRIKTPILAGVFEVDPMSNG